MKLLHEVGIIKDGNRKVGVILKKGGISNNSPWLMGSMEQFYKSVKDGKVQYFDWDASKNKPIVSYTDEEIGELRRLGVEPLYGEDYFRRDLVFKKKYIDLIDKDIIYAKIISINEVPIMGDIVNVVFFGKKELIIKQYERLRTLFDRTIMKECIKFSGNNITFAMNLYDVFDNKIITDTKEFIVDTSNVIKQAEIIKDNERFKSAGVKEVTGYKIHKIVNHLEKVNKTYKL